MIWSLYIDTYKSMLVVSPGDITPGASDHYLLVSRRDPDTPIEFRTGGVYFNPLFKDGGTLHPYVMNGEQTLVSIFNGKSPRKHNKEKAAIISRGWFELPPRPLTEADIHPDLFTLIRNQPSLHGAIAQVARATMNMRIPEGMQARSFDQWIAWFIAQQTPLPLRLKVVFQLISSRPQALLFTDKDTHRLLTGEEPEPQALVKFRWYRYETVRVVRRQIKESAEWELELPLSVIQQGEAAIMAIADQKFGQDWRDVNDSIPMGMTEQSSETAEMIEGPLIWHRPAGLNSAPFVPLGPKSAEERPASINDLFQIAIQNNN